jgi:hypothetical protein
MECFPETIGPSIYTLEFYAELSVYGQQIPVNTRGGFAAVVHCAYDTVRHAESIQRPTTCRGTHARSYFSIWRSFK